MFVPTRDKKGISIVNAFKKIVDNSKIKPNKIWLMKVVNFTIFGLKSFWKRVYSTFNEGKSVVAERFIN